jgi:hypothetical protein
MPVILAIWRQTSGESRFKASLGKELMRTPSPKSPEKNGLEGGVAQTIEPQTKP